MPDLFTLLQAAEGHSWVTFTLILAIISLIWFIKREIRKGVDYFDNKFSELDELSVLGVAVKKSLSTGIEGDLVSHKEILDEIKANRDFNETLIAELRANYCQESCPHRLAIEQSIRDSMLTMDLIRERITEMVSDTKDVSHELLDFAGALLEHLARSSKDPEQK